MTRGVFRLRPLLLRRFLPLLLPVLLPVLLVVGACARYQVARGPAKQAATHAVLEARRRPIRLELMDGNVVTMVSANVAGDSVFGFSAGWVGTGMRSFPISEIRRVEYRAYSDVDTAVLVGALTVVPAAVGLLVWLLVR